MRQIQNNNVFLIISLRLDIGFTFLKRTKVRLKYVVLGGIYNLHTFPWAGSCTQLIYFLRHVKTRIGILANYQNSTIICYHFSFHHLMTNLNDFIQVHLSYAIERALSANSFACFRWRDVKQIGRKGRKNSARMDQFFTHNINGSGTKLLY